MSVPVGFLNIYKEKGMTSHDVVARVRRIVGLKKVGHAGTLDPEAEGVLLVGLGRATKYISYLEQMDKTYLAQVIFGKSTDTYDITGEIQEERLSSLTQEAVEGVLSDFRGDLMQVPTIYSAIKKNGRKLYDYARRGEAVEIEARPITISHLEVMSWGGLPGEIQIKVTCSKGTYIRSLCHDIGRALETPACMGSLLRQEIGRFKAVEAIRLDKLESTVEKDNLSQVLIPPDAVLSHFQTLRATPRGEHFIRNGNALFQWNAEDDFGQLTQGEILRIYDRQGFVGLGQFKEDEEGPQVVPLKLL
ncbi:tRNA pseudouridine(55) synthase TruB [Eubacterium aggregans]|uniref:tRNA pseudouridine(55) synthase TruB n=2 Tax=Eubacterium aggregans TaxID=81409 RepID=UPI003F2FAF47